MTSDTKLPRRRLGASGLEADRALDLGMDLLDTDAIGAYPGRVLITSGDTGPDWLPRIARTVARGIDAPVRVIDGAGHTPQHTHPEAFAAAIIG